MRLSDSIFFLKGAVWHTRHLPIKNAFKYPVSYVVTPLRKLEQFDKGLLFGLNRPALISLYMKDYGAKGLKPNRQWVTDQFAKVEQQVPDGEIVLVAMPRCLGYVFNPVCFWLCFDAEENLRAVVTEVNNTFGETHIYLCSKEGGESIQRNDELRANKVFHVSPFFGMAGGYRFRFDINSDRIGISINYHSDDEALLLSTRLAGPLRLDSSAARAGVLLHAPLGSILSMTQICWQALKLRMKGLPWIPKPKQLTPNFSCTHQINSSKVKAKA